MCRHPLCRQQRWIVYKNQPKVSYSVYDLCRHPHSYQSPVIDFGEADVQRCPLTPSDVDRSSVKSRKKRAAAQTAGQIRKKLRKGASSDLNLGWRSWLSARERAALGQPEMVRVQLLSSF